MHTNLLTLYCSVRKKYSQVPAERLQMDQQIIEPIIRESPPCSQLVKSMWAELVDASLAHSARMIQH